MIECRRLLSILAIPWVGVIALCLLASWYCLFVVGIDALLAPVLKAWSSVKPLLFKVLPALLLWLWIHTGAKIAGWISELIVLGVAMLGGWKVWSLKKLVRQSGRFVASVFARFVAIGVFLNLLFGRERLGVRSLPGYTLAKLDESPLGRFADLWLKRSDRFKRLVLGLILCLVLVMVGQKTLGYSVLLFDLAWELVLILASLIARLWRFLAPVILRFIPNFIGNFFTKRVLPLIADIVPVIKDDQRVIYMRFNLRYHYRRFKAGLYLKSRRQRGDVRKRLQPLVGEKVRRKKTQLLDDAANYRKKDSAQDGQS